MPKSDLKTYKGNIFLGIDVGSTTTKAVVLGQNGELLYSSYNNNEGSPLNKTLEIIKEKYILINKVGVIPCGITPDFLIIKVRHCAKGCKEHCYNNTYYNWYNK